MQKFKEFVNEALAKTVNYKYFSYLDSSAKKHEPLCKWFGFSEKKADAFFDKIRNNWTKSKPIDYKDYLDYVKFNSKSEVYVFKCNLNYFSDISFFGDIDIEFIIAVEDDILDDEYLHASLGYKLYQENKQMGIINLKNRMYKR